MPSKQLIEKYHVAAPRYTSYPTVPYWNPEMPDVEKWKQSVRFSFNQSNAADGISLYIHLPYCESLCTYCGCNTRISRNHLVEKPYIRTVLKEWQLYVDLFETKPLIREIHLGGGTPTFFNTENLAFLINGILKNAAVHPKAEFSFEAHPGNTTEAHLTTLFDLGFRRLSLGIQDFNPKVQLIINRVQSYQQVENITRLARKIGYTSINYDLIYGLPLQTKDGLAETMQAVLSLRPERIAFYSYAHVPWIKPGQRRYTENDLPSTEMKQELYELGREILKSGGYQEIGMDHFTLQTDSLYEAKISGKLHRNFMGYTHQYSQLMIGLGVSSISDTWFAFAQNEKKVEDYTRMVNEGQFPIFKGHVLIDEDLIIRKHILNLMCKGNTLLDETMPNASFTNDFFVRLQELELDDLIKINTKEVCITPLGKRFLRNICMAFDARFWAKKPASQVFSMAG
ncbi:MAG: oxygen-independent coproporphyrinogen III oxidase [Janthinobacterium lividum]